MFMYVLHKIFVIALNYPQFETSLEKSIRTFFILGCYDFLLLKNIMLSGGYFTLKSTSNYRYILIRFSDMKEKSH